MRIEQAFEEATCGKRVRHLIFGEAEVVEGVFRFNHGMQLCVLTTPRTEKDWALIEADEET